MAAETIAIAVLLGIVEGLTEFIPVSSTGHLILLVDLLGFRGPPGEVFEISIQLGAILAVCWLYRERLLGVAVGLPRERRAQGFVWNLVLAVLPAVVIGVLAHDFIKTVLFSPWVVSVSLVVGGFAILVIERMEPRATVLSVDAISPRTALAIGFCQAVAMIPGVSRSGATIMGALLFGVERKAATEFSFFLAIPTMLGATVYDLYDNRVGIDGDGLLVIAVGFIAAFAAAFMVVRWLIGFVSRNGFTSFAWYRIALGALMLILLAWG